MPTIFTAEESSEIREIVRKNTVPGYIFPRLLQRHAQQAKEAGSASPVLFHRQLHEIYTFSLFRHVALSSSCEISADGVAGISMSPVDLTDLLLATPATKEEFFDALLYTPVPFIFIPKDLGGPKQLGAFCKSPMRFQEKSREGIIFDRDFATLVGVDFLGLDLLESGRITTFYYGIVYDKVL